MHGKLIMLSSNSAAHRRAANPKTLAGSKETTALPLTTSADLQNILYSADVALLFLDAGLHIRFFTPAAQTILNLTAEDVGRSLDDQDALSADARTVLRTHAPCEHVIEGEGGSRFIRRMAPCRTPDDMPNGETDGGVVVTFTDITAQKSLSAALEAAQARAEQVAIEKSSFLDTVKHDLRQPLQTLALLQGILVKTVDREKTDKLLAQLDETLTGMSSLLNTLLDETNTGAALASEAGAGTAPGRPANDSETEVRHGGTILVIEDDAQVRELLACFLEEEGYQLETAPDGYMALELVERESLRPDLILSDYNLPNGLNGFQVTAKLREKLRSDIPVIILTGDLSAGTVNDIALQNCLQINKPVRLMELSQLIARLLPITATSELVPPATDSGAPSVSENREPAPPSTIFIVDDNRLVREALRAALEADGRTVADYATCEAFLEAYRPSGDEACLLIDAYLPGMKGLELLQRLSEAGHQLPAIMITGNSDVPMAVQAMKAGASDFIEKPISYGELIASVERALERSRDSSKLSTWRESAAHQVADLTPRQREIMELVLAGHPSKNIAADLGISQRTVENHRALIMKKTGSKSLPALARLALAATWNGGSSPPA